MPQTTIKDCMARIEALEQQANSSDAKLDQILDHLTQKAEPLQQPVEQAQVQRQTVTTAAQAMPKASDNVNLFLHVLKGYRTTNSLKKNQGVKMCYAAKHLTPVLQLHVPDWTQSDTYTSAIEAVEQGDVVIGTGWSMRLKAQVDPAKPTHQSKLDAKQFVAHYQGR